MKRTYQDFIDFARTFEEQNHFDFSEAAIEQIESIHPIYAYDATYRDESNYKSNVRITYNGFTGAIEWNVAEGWQDAIDEIEALYEQMFEKHIEKQLDLLCSRLTRKESDRYLLQLLQSIKEKK